MAGRQLGSEQCVAEPELARVDRHDGRARARSVAERHRHAVADLGVRGACPPLAECDRGAVQCAE